LGVLNSGCCLCLLLSLQPHPSPFYFSYFSDRVSCFCHNPTTSPSLVLGGMHHPVWLVFWDRVSLTFYLGWPQTQIFLPPPPE
jgi:hypothetical protein